jgi:hypothetical protein
MAAVRGTPSGVPVSLIPGLPPCAQLSPIRVVTNVAAPYIKESDNAQHESVQNLAFPSTQFPIA